MPQIIADLQLHSKYSRAVSPQMLLPNLALWAAKKGIRILVTGDATHPLWFKEISEKLEPAEPGLYSLKKIYRPPDQSGIENIRFVLGGEVSCIYTKNGKGRRIHHLFYLPNIEVLAKFNRDLGLRGNIRSDGRPIIGLDSKELLHLLLDASSEAVLIPAHVWTPWFGIFGSMSGFNSLEECFDELAPQIFAIETGLSSDPPMNWRIPFLDDRAIISGSDSHSLHRLGREATIFNLPTLSYQEIMDALRTRDKRLAATIEFFPEEGRYHYDGHRQCNISWTPEQTKKHKGICPVCGRKVTVGVMARIAELAAPDRPQGFKPPWAKPFYSFVALDEIIAETLDVGKTSKAVWKEYDNVIKKLGSEYEALLHAPQDKLRGLLSPLLAEGILRMRRGEVKIKPGFDGEYGVISLFTEEERTKLLKPPTLF